jgi:release factor glutamine methyltransferase
VGYADIVQRLRAAGCVFAEDEAAILCESTDDPARLDEMVTRRCGGVPLEQVVGWAQFAGVRLVVHPGVFVPRRRTEALVRVAVSVLKPGAVVLDICCGTGAIGAAIATAVPDVRLWASDVDPAAVRNAQVNLARFGGVVSTGDMDEAIPATLRGAVDVLVANVPYVPSGEIAYLPAEAREHESRLALDGGDDGLDVLRRLAPRVLGWLSEGGWFMTECAPSQAPTALAAMHEVGLDALVHNDNELDVAIAAGQRRIATDSSIS